MNAVAFSLKGFMMGSVIDIEIGKAEAEKWEIQCWKYETQSTQGKSVDTFYALFYVHQFFNWIFMQKKR